MADTSEILGRIIECNTNISNFLLQMTGTTHQLHDERETLKRMEDAISVAIWNNPEMKNDRVRNEAKHLARINDDGLISQTAVIRELETLRAILQGRVMAEQSTLQILLIAYEHERLGGRMQSRVTAALAPMKDVDTTDVLKVVTDIEAANPDLQPETLRERLRRAMTPERYAALTGDDALAALNMPTKPAKPLTEKEEQEKAPYLKNSTDKKPEKLGGVRY